VRCSCWSEIVATRDGSGDTIADAGNAGSCAQRVLRFEHFKDAVKYLHRLNGYS
jgi:hypothetical protein